jgi:DNA invertase Pin-like site-specific DNA recombinase
MARVYSYIRFSDAKQATGASSDRQRDYAQRWAKDHGLELDQELSLRDEGLSAYHQRHITQGALGTFLAAINDGRVPRGSVLVVEGLDRLSRAEPIQAQGQLAGIINAGITVVTASDNRVYSRERLKDNPMDLVHSLLVMIRAHEESETKSKRVRDAIRRQCQGWVAGTYRGLVRVGQTPGWLQVVDGKWQTVPERLQAMRLVVDQYRAGQGTANIARTLAEKGLSVGNGAASSGHLQRLLAHPALIGEKHVNLGPEDEYVLQGYYPAIVSAAEWAHLQQLLASRSRTHVRGTVPSLITGMGIAKCGYCGAPLKAQTMTSKLAADGTLADSQRRLQCVANNAGGCTLPGSCSAAPIERALVRYCSDLVNLQALYDGDRASIPKAELAAAEARQAKIELQLTRITEALLASDDQPATFLRRARELEAELDACRRQVATAQQGVQDAQIGRAHV